MVHTAFAITITLEPLIGPLIVPAPLIDQECVGVPPEGVTVDVYELVVPAQTEAVPEMLQLGVAVTFIVLVVLTTTPHAGELFVVNVNVTTPVKLGGGVYVTV